MESIDKRPDLYPEGISGFTQQKNSSYHAMEATHHSTVVHTKRQR